MKVFSRLLPVAALCCVMAWASMPVIAVAQDSFIMDILREQQPAQRQQQRQRDQAPAATPAPGPSEATIAATPIPLKRTYCVRSCDGYYFAIGFVRDEGDLSEHETMCAASCGTAEMRLLTSDLETDMRAAGNTGPAIERAVTSDGTPYTALANAFRFRDGDQKACACSSTTSGLPQVPLELDPTLRQGDIVVTAEGLKVFRGERGAPHEERDFVGVARSRAISAEVRRQLLMLETRIQE